MYWVPDAHPHQLLRDQSDPGHGCGWVRTWVRTWVARATHAQLSRKFQIAVAERRRAQVARASERVTSLREQRQRKSLCPALTSLAAKQVEGWTEQWECKLGIMTRVLGEVSQMNTSNNL